MRLYESQPSGTITDLRALRRNAPEPERRILRALREAFPQPKWRHQAPIAFFRVDLLCLSERLVIEVDGETHAGAESYDARRSETIARQGFDVIRFSNADVMTNLDGVVAAISLSLRKREGAPEAREGEDAPCYRPSSPSPSHAARRRGPLPLPMGEEK